MKVRLNTGDMKKIKKGIRWAFLVGFLVFAVFMNKMNVINSNPNLFILFWLLASFCTIAGVLYFKDKIYDGQNDVKD